jgi:hypothetical protein
MSASMTRTVIAHLPLHCGKGKTYDQSIELLSKAINKTKLGIG